MRTVEPLKKAVGLSSLQRPRFSPGLLLEDEDLTAGVHYTREMMRLLFRSLFGCGVICGLEVKATLACHRRELHIVVEPGIALDCEGNPIHVAKAVQIIIDRACDPVPAMLWVAVCYTERCCRPRDVMCSPDEDNRPVHTRSHDAFEVRVYGEHPPCACSCDKPKTPRRDPPRGNCCDGDDDAAGSAAADAPTGAAEQAETPDDPCACYKKHLDGECCDCSCRCVLIATIDTTLDKDKKAIEPKRPSDAQDDVRVWTSTKVRRWIRPLLTGMLKCEEEKAAVTASSGTGAAAYTGRPRAGGAAS